MSRYRPRHSSRIRESERSAPVRRAARRATAAVAAAFVVIVASVVLMTGGVERALETLSGAELKAEEAALSAEFETASPEATTTIETSVTP